MMAEMMHLCPFVVVGARLAWDECHGGCCPEAADYVSLGRQVGVVLNKACTPDARGLADDFQMSGAAVGQRVLVGRGGARATW